MGRKKNEEKWDGKMWIFNRSLPAIFSVQFTTLYANQWRNRWGVRGRAECPPETSDWEISADLPGKERQGKKENGAEKKEN